MVEFKLTDPYGTTPTQAPFSQSVSRGLPWRNLPVTREYTLGQLLDQTIARCGENDAVVYADRDYRLTWYEFGEEVDRLARGLMALGVKRGEKIALWATNVPHWVVLMFAAAKIGAILLPLNTNYKEHEMDFALKQSDTENLFIINGYRDCSYVDVIYTLVPELREQPRGELRSEKYPHLKRVMFLGGEKHRGMYSMNEVMSLAVETPWEDYLKRQGECDVNDVVNMQYTSGTTGFPKGVQLTHRNIANDGFWIGACQNLTCRDRVCIPVPLFHCFGCVLGVMSCVNHGSTMVFLEKFDPIQVMMSIEREKCTAVYGVPTMYIAMLDHPLFSKFDFHSLRTGIMSGSACPVHRMQQVVDRMYMKEVCNPYGLTESGPVMTMTRSFEPSIERPGAARHRGGHHRPRDRRDRPARHGRRDLLPRLQQHEGLLQHARADREVHRLQRLAALGRHRPDGQGRLLLHHRTPQGPHHPRRREHIPQGGRGLPRHHARREGRRRRRLPLEEVRRTAGRVHHPR